jgi:hypothetical protein
VHHSLICAAAGRGDDAMTAADSANPANINFRMLFSSSFTGYPLFIFRVVDGWTHRRVKREPGRIGGLKRTRPTYNSPLGTTATIA